MNISDLGEQTEICKILTLSHKTLVGLQQNKQTNKNPMKACDM